MKKFLFLVLALSALAPLASAQKAELAPTAGQQFVFQNKVPKYITCDLEVRDPSDKFWPNFFYGRAVDGGTYTFDGAVPQAKFSVVFDQMTQPRGDQSRKVLGELCAPDKFPVITFAVNGMKPFQTEMTEAEQRGKKTQKSVTFSELDAVFQIGNKVFKIAPKATFNYAESNDKNNKPDGVPDSVTITAKMDLTGRDLGLEKYGAATPLALRVTVLALAAPK
jgi:hypothetical protein